jgi:SWI/SNF-related matrix-associated actin-dependent regulator of chromatin subfamily D
MTQPPQQPPIQLVNPVTGAISTGVPSVQPPIQTPQGILQSPSQFTTQKFIPMFSPGNSQQGGIPTGQPAFPSHQSVMTNPVTPNVIPGAVTVVKPNVMVGTPMPVPVQVPGHTNVTFHPTPSTPGTPGVSTSWSMSNMSNMTPNVSPAQPKPQFMVANTPTKFSPMQGQVIGTPGTPHTPMTGGQHATPGSGQGSNTGGSNVATAANIQVLAAQIPAVLTGIDMRRRDWPARRVARDKDEEIQEELRSFAEDSKLFGRLLAFEKLVDASIKKRHTHISEALPRENNQTVTVTRVLRLCIYNTFENQGGTYQNETAGVGEEAASWSLRIEGKLREDVQQPVNTKVKIPADRKFSSFFKKIFIQLDKDLYPDNWLIEWNKDSSATADTEGFEIKRVGSKEFTVNLFLHLDHKPARYKLSPQLAQLLQLNDSYTKTHVILSLWHYIRKAKLQDAEQRSVVHLDEPLRQIFGVSKFDYVDIPNLLHQHLGPPDPIQLSYTIKLGGNPENHEQWYQIPVEVENPAATLKTNPNIKKDIETLNQKIHENILKIKEKKRKREFFGEFADDPVGFMNEFLTSQIRDHKYARTIGRDIEEERHASFYRNPLIKDAINHYLYKLPMKQEIEYSGVEIDATSVNGDGANSISEK